MRIAAVDQGTTSTRCLVVEDGGHWRFAGACTHKQQHPAAGWVEHDPEELLRNIRLVLDKAGPVDGIALANQGESCLAWDAVTQQPLSNVIVWQDARTAAALAGLSPEDQQLSRDICGLPLDPYFSASKLSWLLRHVPAVQRAHTQGRLRLGTTDAFFIDRLCGRFVTDVATASRTGLLDLRTRRWSEALCALHQIPIECLPEIVPVNGDFGTVAGTPLRVSIVDQQAALYGHDCRRAGDCKITFGTGAFLLAVTGTNRPSTDHLLPTIAWQKDGEDLVFALEAGVYDAGAALEWCRNIGLFSELAELNTFEGPSALSRGIVFVPALSGLGAPHWDRHAAPLFIGMDHSTNQRDLLRAVLEGIAMLTACLVAEASQVLVLGDTVSIDGGLSQSAYFAQFFASACQRKTFVPAMHERTAVGLAVLAGVDVQDSFQDGAMFEPDERVSTEDRARFAEALRRSGNWRR